MGQYFNKEISKKELAAMSFAISFGLVIGFGIPTSIAASIILIHCLLLTTDMIGSFCPDTKAGTILSAAIGAGSVSYTHLRKIAMGIAITRYRMWKH